MSRGLLIMNLGTPDAPETGPVRRYLREFLMDPRVLDIPWALRAFIVNAMILPRRPAASAEAYRKIWTERGSPLLFHGQDLVDKVQARVGDRFAVALCMRYQNPSPAAVLAELRAQGVDDIVLFPLFPQYSSAAWGSAVERVFAEASSLWNVPAVQVVPPYFDHPEFIAAFAEVARPVLDEFEPDFVLQSYHGVPERHCTKSDLSEGAHCLQSDDCCAAIVAANRYCYRAHCFATARALAEALGLEHDAYDVSFQSRLGRDPWIRPYTDERVVELAGRGIKRLAVACPAFTADCLETIEEIGMRAREDFIANGGDDLHLIPSLNSTDRWADAVVRLVEDARAPA